MSETAALDVAKPPGTAKVAAATVRIATAVMSSCLGMVGQNKWVAPGRGGTRGWWIAKVRVRRAECRD